MLLSFIFCAPLAAAADIFNYGAFTQTATYSLATQLGFFSAYNLNVIYHQVPNSSAAYASVLGGEYDLLTGTIDNAVNLRFNTNRNLTVLGQIDQGPDLVLASVPSITNIAQLTNKPLIVDSPVSGYAYLLKKMLKSNGLVEGGYVLQTVGSTNLRYADLVAGGLGNGSTVYATILTYPFTAYGQVLPAAQRLNILARLSSYENPISSTALTIAQSSLANSTKSDLLTRFVSAMYAANLYLNNVHNKKCAVKSIQKQLNITAATALLEYEAATNLTTGEISPGGNFTVNQAGLKNIIAVRQEFGGFTVPSNFSFGAAIVPGAGKLIDYSIRDKAVAALKSKLLSTKC